MKPDCLAQLLQGTTGGRMGGHIEMNQATTAVLDHHE